MQFTKDDVHINDTYKFGLYLQETTTSPYDSERQFGKPYVYSGNQTRSMWKKYQINIC
jgi:hypothetical protein